MLTNRFVLAFSRFPPLPTASVVVQALSPSFPYCRGFCCLDLPNIVSWSSEQCLDLPNIVSRYSEQCLGLPNRVSWSSEHSYCLEFPNIVPAPCSSFCTDHGSAAPCILRLEPDPRLAASVILHHVRVGALTPSFGSHEKTQQVQQQKIPTELLGKEGDKA